MTLKEDAAAGSVSATAIAGVRSRLGGRIKRIVPMTNKKKELDAKTIKESSFSSFLKEFANDPTPVDIIGKLSQNAKQSDDLDGDGVATYGLETEDGGIVKVLVAREQAKDFEKALSDALQELGDDNNAQDIAELLFDLNDQFHIVDVVWPTIQEDEEEPTNQDQLGDAPIDPNADPMADPNADPMADPSMDPNADPAGMGDDGMGGDTGGVQSALDQIIDFLKSDAEARKAEADAKAAEARAKEAEAAGRAAEVKMAGEEEILNAEDYFKQQKDADKEANRLKMLAKYRQATSGGSSDQMASQGDVGSSRGSQSGGGAPEEEEVTSRLRKTLLSILRGQ